MQITQQKSDYTMVFILNVRFTTFFNSQLVYSLGCVMVLSVKFILVIRGVRIDPNVDSIDTNVGAGIGSII